MSNTKPIFKHKRIAIDFDGTLFLDEATIDITYSEHLSLKPLPGASETTCWLKELGFELLIFTCRPDYHRKYLEEQLKSAGIAYDYILFYTKPRVDLYIDDKGFRFTTWEATKQWLQNQIIEHKSGPIGQEPRNPVEDALCYEKMQWLPSQWESVLDVGCGSGRTWLNVMRRPSLIDGLEPDPVLRAEAQNTGIFSTLYGSLDNIQLDKYDGLSLLGVLEHVEDDIAFLNNLSSCKALYLTVPNGDSFHRHLGIALGIIDSPSALSIHDHEIGHKRYYTYESLKGTLEQFIDQQNQRFRISAYGTSSFKFGNNDQMQPFLDKFKEISATANKCGICGLNNRYGAEIFALLESHHD